MNTFSDRPRVLGVASIVVVLAACGGGGGGGGNTNAFPSYPATTADSTLLPLVTAAGELKLFNPAAPNSAPITMDTGLPLPDHFGSGNSAYPFANVLHTFGATYNATTNATLGFHHRFAWYFKDGTPYRVDLLNTSSHEPVQFSSITDACDFNGFAIDYSNPLNTRFSVRVAGADTSCYTADDAGSYFTLGAAASDAGQVVPADFFIIESVPAMDGSLQRILGYQYETGEFTSNAPDLSSSTLMMTVADGMYSGGPDQDRTHQYVRLQPQGGARALYRYDAADDSLTPVHTFAAAGGSFTFADTDYLYFLDGDQVFRVAHTSTTPQPIHTFEATAVLQEANLSAGRLVFVLQSTASGMTTVESLPKTGAATRAVLEAPTGMETHLFATGGSLVYYNVGNSAMRVAETGSGRVAVENANWTGAQANPDANIGALNPELLVRTLMLGQIDGMGVASVRGVDARTGIAGPVLGTIPNAVAARSALDSRGRYALLNVLVDRGFGTEDFDVYFVDIPTANSLRAVAATPDLDDVAP